MAPDGSLPFPASPWDPGPPPTPGIRLAEPEHKETAPHSGPEVVKSTPLSHRAPPSPITQLLVWRGLLVNAAPPQPCRGSPPPSDLSAHLHPFTAFFCCLGILAGATWEQAIPERGEQSQRARVERLAEILKA